MPIANCWTSDRRMLVQKDGNSLYAGHTIYNSGHLVVDDLREPQNLSNSHTSLLLSQHV
jgi:hypothetical protein